MVPDSIVTQLAAYTTGTVTRLAGSDRYSTAAAICSASFEPGVPVAYVAVGDNFPDALAAGPVAGINGGPVLLATRDSIPSATKSELARLAPLSIVVVGGPGVISDAVLTQLAGYVAD